MLYYLIFSEIRIDFLLKEDSIDFILRHIVKTLIFAEIKLTFLKEKIISLQEINSI